MTSYSIGSRSFFTHTVIADQPSGITSDFTSLTAFYLVINKREARNDCSHHFRHAITTTETPFRGWAFVGKVVQVLVFSVAGGGELGSPSREKLEALP